MSETTLAPLEYYARHGAALFPIPAGQKAPFGIVSSFKHDFSRDPEVWHRWQQEHPGCNFGVVAFASHWITLDIDTSGGEEGRAEAWALWSELCASWGVPAPLIPHIQSASGGWHAYFAVPQNIDASTLRQPDAIKKRINVRCVGYTVAAGSNFEARPYLLMSDAPPYPAPTALIEHCTRVPRKHAQSTGVTGARDRNDIAALLTWLNEHGTFEAYEDWFQCGMALKLEYGDDALDLWQLTHDGTVSADVEESKWNSFATDPTAQSITLSTFLDKAHKLGWRGTVRKSTAAMFEGVAAIAAAAGATLSSAPQVASLLDSSAIVAGIGQPILDNFLAGTKDAPTRPGSNDYPTLPDLLSEHPLFDQLKTSIERIFAMAESPKSFRQERMLKVLGVLHRVHPTICDQVVQRITAGGCVINPGKLDAAVRNFEGAVRIEQSTAAGFITDSKGFPAPENSDNVYAFVRQRQVKLRFNAWKDHPEISDNNRDEFIQFTDHVLGDLFMDAKSSQFNYHVGKELFRTGLVSTARKTMYDPLLERIDALAPAWDGVARLDTWLSHCVGVPTDSYHMTVGRNLIGGLVRRARRPGCEQAETVIFISPAQGTGKSTLCKILALDPAWHTDSFKFGGSQQNTIPQLAGKWVIELSELAGMNKSDVEDIKNFMSATTDNYTKKYEAFATDHPRRCCFIGTSNDKRPLADASGGRRFLPVHVVGEVNTDWLRANVEQIIGECAHREAQGESFAIPRDVWETTAQHQEAARSRTPVEELCQEWFDRPHSAYGYFITATDIGRALKMAGQSQYARYAPFLDKMGWRDANLVVPGTGRKARVWMRHTNNRLDECARLLPSQTQTNGPVELRPSMSPTLPPPMPAPPY
jgi:predicted P-loop ATPase